MNEEDKTRLFRDCRLTLSEIEKIIMALNDTKAFYFRAGIQDRYHEYDELVKKLKQYWIKG